MDPITLEVIRAKLEAIADDGARTIVRTAISPIVADAKDCSCAIYTTDGELIAGGGHVEAHFHTGVNGVRAILDTHGGTIASGDLFLVNDPYTGGGFHAQDVFIHQPVFHQEELVAWVGTSAHMMDMGGGAPGSFVPAATECYQEAIRIPPVRLARAGEEQADVWAILLNNIRMADIVSMDMRALISGTNFVASALDELAESYGAGVFKESARTLISLSEIEFRKRINKLASGDYSAIRWVEWTESDYRVPCRLTIKQDKLVFDFSGSSPQTTHYYNSKPYVILSLLGVQIAGLMAQDLPFNEGIFRCIRLVCPEGSIVNARPPAPIGGPHLEVGNTAVEAAMHSLILAVAASPQHEAYRMLANPLAVGGLGLHGWAAVGHMGQPDNWLMLEGGGALGPSAGHDRDANDWGPYEMAKGAMTEFPDTETMEDHYPIRICSRDIRKGPQGAGRFRSGHGAEVSYRGFGDTTLFGLTMGNRERIPTPGLAGGYPGSLNVFEIEGIDGQAKPVLCHQQDIVLKPGETFTMRISSGGGWGDPLDRDVAAVELDVREGRITEEEAFETYGVIVGNAERTEQQRDAILMERLSRAAPAPRGMAGCAPKPPGSGRALYPGVEDQGGVAVSLRSGALLAKSPDHWTEGCPRIHGFLDSHPSVDIVAYLDPLTGHTLVVDVVKIGDVERGFGCLPDFWTGTSHGLETKRGALAA